MKKAEFKQKLAGGLADKKSPSDFDSKKLQEGQKVESEHTNDSDTAKEIAMDHLTEDKNYYKKLKSVEKSFKNMYGYIFKADGMPKAPAAPKAPSAPKAPGFKPRKPWPGEDQHKLSPTPKPEKTHVPAGGFQPHYTDYTQSPQHGELTPEGAYKHLTRNLQHQGKDVHGHITFNPKTKHIEPITAIGQEHLNYAQKNPHMLKERTKWSPQEHAKAKAISSPEE